MSEHEDRYGQETHTSLDATDASSFDDLAKGLASGTISRGRALRMLGAALVGGAFASIPGAAWAACKQPFSKCTANTQCCSRQCIKNPKGNGKICGCPTGKTLCPAGNQCVTCSNTGEVVNQTTCKCECPTGQVVCNNACVSNTCSGGKVFNPTTCKCECPTGTQTCGNNCCVEGTECCGGECRPLCAATEQRNPNTCQCEAIGCPVLADDPCSKQAACGGDASNCACLRTTEGIGFCIQHGSCGVPCTSSTQCAPGQACVFSACGCNQQAYCQNPCGVGVSVQAASEAQGPTTFIN